MRPVLPIKLALCADSYADWPSPQETALRASFIGSRAGGVAATEGRAGNTRHRDMGSQGSENQTAQSEIL